MSQVWLTIFLGAEKTKLRVSSEVAKRVSRQIESGKGKWIKVDSAGANLLLDVAEVKGIKIEKAREHKGRLPGFSIQDLSSVTKKDYFFWFRKLKKMNLERISDRRMACSKRNFELLGLTKLEQDELMRLENSRR